MNKPTIFISYSHADEKWKDLLVKHLKALRLEGLLPDTWDDRRIAVGQMWREEIQKAMDSAAAAILLVSVDFLISDFIRSVEIPQLFEQKDKEGMPIFPLIVRPCSWQKVKWLSSIQARPKDGRALSKGSKTRIAEDLSAFAVEVADIVSAQAATAGKGLDHPFGHIEQMHINIEEIQLIKNKKKVFISYAKEDYEVAKQLYEDLKRSGLTPWLDSEELLPGQRWKVVVNQAIKDSSYFLALLSSNSISKNGFVQKELKMALEILDEIPTNKIFIIPIRLDDCKPTDVKLQDLHWVDLFPSYKTGLEKIMLVFKAVV